MSRYVDFYLIGELVDSHGNVHYEDLKNLPTADVVEVKHGHWIKDRLCSTSGGTYGIHRCSVCEDYYQDVGYGWNYCPNCGAKMDEREDEE